MKNEKIIFIFIAFLFLFVGCQTIPAINNGYVEQLQEQLIRLEARNNQLESAIERVRARVAKIKTIGNRTETDIDSIIRQYEEIESAVIEFLQSNSNSETTN